MVAARAQWKGNLHVGALVIPVALYTGASTSERTSFKGSVPVWGEMTP